MVPALIKSFKVTFNIKYEILNITEDIEWRAGAQVQFKPLSILHKKGLSVTQAVEFLVN